LATLILIFLVVLVLGCPVAFSFGISSTIGLWQMGNIPLQLVPQRMFTALDSFPLLAIPLFILAGRLMSTGGIARRIFRFAASIVGHIRGGLGHVNILASMFFAGMSGAAVADAAGLGAIEIPAMVEEGYDVEFSAVVTAASATIGPVIPPSIPMVVFGWLGGVSISKLFLGGVIPGILMGVALMVYVYVVSGRRNYPRRPRATLREVWVSFKESFLALLTPLIIMGGILGGAFTTTEAAVIAVLYTFIVSSLVYREISLKDLPAMFTEVAVDTAAIGLILATASVFAWLLTVYNIPSQLQRLVFSLSPSPAVVLLTINIALLVIGMFLNTTAALILFTPVLVAIGNAIGIDMVHLGVMVVVNLCIGMLTPPVGVVLFVTSSVAKLSITRLLRGMGPVWLALLAVLLLITYVPALTTFIPSLVR